MNRRSRSLYAALLIVACSSSARLPPGTPPPEYEVPVVPPWPPDGGSPAQPPVAPAPVTTPDTGATGPAVLSGDAGLR